MNLTNLMPIARQQQRVCRVRLRAWAVACGLLGFTLAATAVWSRCAAGDDKPIPFVELSRVSQQISRDAEAAHDLQSRIALVRHEMQSVRFVSDQPDWSLLLQLVSNSLGDDVVLKSCDLTHRAEAPVPMSARDLHPAPVATVHPAPEPPHRETLILHLAGFARSQAEVSNFVLRLEAIGLFQNVKLLQSARQPLLAGEAIGFELECPIRAGQESQR